MHMKAGSTTAIASMALVLSAHTPLDANLCLMLIGAGA